MKKLLLASAAIALFAASNANAAANLTSVAITGASGTVWNTTQDAFYTVFIQAGFGTALNGTNPTVNYAPSAGANRFTIAGDGWPSSSVLNSDAVYTIRLGFADGAVVTGDYNSVTNLFTAGQSATVGGTTYAVTGFGWNRNPQVDVVSGFAPTPGDNSSDYTGLFAFNASAVPEPATWAMMLVGFAMVGATARYRRRSTQVVYS